MRQDITVWSAALLGIVVIGVVDGMSGVELRVFPLYYLPISILAWHVGLVGAAVASALSTASWVFANALAGLQFSGPWIWVANTLLLATSFGTVGLLIAKLHAVNLRERALSRTDPLTSLSNSRAFYEDAARVLAHARRYGRPLTLAYLDLDNFKRVNDSLGHQAGDALLQRIAALIRGSLRAADLSARMGGDEFVLLLPEVSAKDAAAALERLRFEMSSLLPGGAAQVTVSIGAVTFDEAPDRLEDMVQAADVLMYEAKSAGRNGVRLLRSPQTRPTAVGGLP